MLVFERELLELCPVLLCVGLAGLLASAMFYLDQYIGD